MRGWLHKAMNAIDREAWIRFLLAILGLALAFAAALLSTAAREAGNVLATAILASSALLLAGAVGVLTVPFLARRVAVERVKEALNYEVTKEGAVYLAFCLIIAVAALNTGNNLLFLVVSAMLGAIIVSGIASALVLRSLEAQLELPMHVFAGQDYTAVLTVRNRRRFLPAFSVTVVPPPERRPVEVKWTWTRSAFVFPKELPGRKPWVRWPDYSLSRVRTIKEAQDVFRDRVYFPYVPARHHISTEVDLRFARRGQYQQKGLGISTRFPFSFLRKTRTVRLGREIIVYPPVEPADEFFEILPMITGEFESYVRGRGYDLYRIRDYAPEDSARHVDWKSTAKSGSLKVREFTREDERKLRIVFDNPAPGQTDGNRYEHGIALAASLAWHFAGENTDLGFAAGGLAGGADVFEFLEYLALVQPATGTSVLDSLAVTDDYNLVFTARPRGTIPTALWQSSYFVFFSE